MLDQLTVAIAGASGLVGRPLADDLAAGGHRVRRLHRHAAEHPVDLTSGHGLASALAGVDVVVHAQNGPPNRAEPVVVDGTRRLLAAAPDAHHVLISIVGIDEVAPHLRYYRAKLAQEALIRSADRWSILRTTQFHEFVGAPALKLGRFGLALRSSVPLAPLAAAEAAAALGRIATAAPTHAIRELAGPATLTVSQLAPRAGVPVPLPLPPRLGRVLRAGALVPRTPDARGVRTYADWLAEAAGRPWRALSR